MKHWKRHGTEILLLFSDMIMPGDISRYDLARALKAEKPDLKIILTSGYSEAITDLSDEIAADNIVFPPKPYTGLAVVAAVRLCLDKEN